MDRQELGNLLLARSHTHWRNMHFSVFVVMRPCACVCGWLFSFNCLHCFCFLYFESLFVCLFLSTFQWLQWFSKFAYVRSCTNVLLLYCNIISQSAAALWAYGCAGTNNAKFTYPSTLQTHTHIYTHKTDKREPLYDFIISWSPLSLVKITTIMLRGSGSGNGDSNVAMAVKTASPAISYIVLKQNAKRERKTEASGLQLLLLFIPTTTTTTTSMCDCKHCCCRCQCWYLHCCWLPSMYSQKCMACICTANTPLTIRFVAFVAVAQAYYAFHIFYSFGCYFNWLLLFCCGSTVFAAHNGVLDSDDMDLWPFGYNV